MKETCVLCGCLERQDRALRKHHITYTPEQTILVCDSCYSKIHLGVKFTYLKPPKNERQKLIELKRKKRKEQIEN